MSLIYGERWKCNFRHVFCCSLAISVAQMNTSPCSAKWSNQKCWSLSVLHVRWFEKFRSKEEIQIILNFSRWITKCNMAHALQTGRCPSGHIWKLDEKELQKAELLGPCLVPHKQIEINNMFWILVCSELFAPTYPQLVLYDVYIFFGPSEEIHVWSWMWAVSFVQRLKQICTWKERHTLVCFCHWNKRQAVVAWIPMPAVHH